MKKLYYSFAVLSTILLLNDSVFSQVHPAFEMFIQNIHTQPGSVQGQDSLLFFDIHMRWTNSTFPGVNLFEYGISQFNITFNPAMYQTLAPDEIKVGLISLSGLPGENLPGTLASSAAQLVRTGGAHGEPLLQIAPSLPSSSVNYIVPTTGDGVRLARIRLRTTQHSWPAVSTNFRFQLIEPNNTIHAYFLPPENPKKPDLQLLEPLTDTIANSYYAQSYVIVGINASGENVLPEDYALNQNYPNPFNPATKINYSVPENGNVSLVVYDVLGKEVKKLVSGFVNAGNYTVDFNAGNLSSGVYYYRMIAGHFSDIRKMVILE